METATLVLQIPSDTYTRLAAEARQLGKSPQVVAAEWLTKHLSTAEEAHLSERQRVRAALQAAGLLTELGPDLRARAERVVDEQTVEAALDRVGGKPLSEIIIEQRGPKG